MTAESTFARLRTEAESQVLAIVAIGAALRFAVGATIGLGVDESYAVAVARQFSLSYFDHPPLHFWIAGGIARIAGTEMPEVVRLPFVLCFAGTTWFTFTVARRLFNERAGVLAALLLNVSAVFSLSTGGWVLPDGPLMVCTTAAVDRITDILFSTGRGGSRLGSWSLAGLLTGLAMLSKYHGVFVVAGTAGFLATSRPHRRWLATPGPYIGTLIALACFAPVLAWNAAHGWASFVFQGARATPSAGVHLGALAANVGAQMVWVLPWIFVPLAASAWRALRAGPRDAPRWFLLSVAAGPIVLFTLVSLRGDVGLPHWEAPGWLFVFPMLGAAAAERLAAGSRRTRLWIRWVAWGYVGMVVFAWSQASTGWVARLWPSAFEHGDPTGDLVTWDGLSGALDSLGFDRSRSFVAATSWIQAGKAAVAAGPSVTVLCLCADPHHFYYMQDERAFLGRDAVIVHKERAGDDVPVRFAPYFESIEPAGSFPVTRGSQVVMTVELFRARRFSRAYDTAQPR